MKKEMILLLLMTCVWSLGCVPGERGEQDSYHTPDQLARIAAVHDRCDDMVRLLMGAAIDARDRAGKTLLHYAARFGAVNVARYVLSRQPSLALMADRAGRLPLHDAIEHGHVVMAELLLSYSHDENNQILHDYTLNHALLARGGALMTLGFGRFEAIGALVRRRLRAANVLPMPPVTQ